MPTSRAFLPAPITSPISYIAMLLALFLATGCDGGHANVDPLAQATGQQFMTAYYRKHDLQQAEELAAGQAKAAIAEQRKLIEAMRSSGTANVEKPGVLVSDKSQRSISETEVLLIYEVKASVPGAKPLEVQLTVSKQDRGWRVSGTEVNTAP